MPGLQTSYEHIAIDEKGHPVIAGTTIKVVELAIEKIVHGWSADELHFQHPYLSLGQIYSALAYYADHQKGLEEDIERKLRSVENLKKEIPSPPFLETLRSKGLI